RAQANLPTPAQEIGGGGQARPDVFCLGQCVALAAAGKYDDELVACIGDAEARLVDRRPDGGADLLDDTAAVQVTVRVDHLLEVVDVHEDEREAPAVDAARFDQALERLVQ